VIIEEPEHLTVACPTCLAEPGQHCYTTFKSRQPGTDCRNISWDRTVHVPRAKASEAKLKSRTSLELLAGGAQPHRCDVCGNIGAWTDAWAWYGTDLHVDCGARVFKTCSDACRANAPAPQQIARIVGQAKRSGSYGEYSRVVGANWPAWDQRPTDSIEVAG
jgi:hypothetical protein